MLLEFVCQLQSSQSYKSRIILNYIGCGDDSTVQISNDKSLHVHPSCVHGRSETCRTTSNYNRIVDLNHRTHLIKPVYKLSLLSNILERKIIRERVQENRKTSSSFRYACLIKKTNMENQVLMLLYQKNHNVLTTVFLFLHSDQVQPRYILLFLHILLTTLLHHQHETHELHVSPNIS